MTPRGGFYDVPVDAVVGHGFIARDRMANGLIETEFHFGRNLLFGDAAAKIRQCFGLHVLDT